MRLRWQGTFFAILFVVPIACGESEDAEGRDSVVGRACSPRDIENADFSGYGLSEITEYENAPECDGASCLVYHLQGRPGCPYGQTVDEVTLPPNDPARCLTPSGEPVTEPVEPQLARRRAAESVFCSCRCSGPDSAGSYCTCPAGTTCESSFGTLGYCVPVGASYDPSQPPLELCQRRFANCEGE